MVVERFVLRGRFRAPSILGGIVLNLSLQMRVLKVSSPAVGAG